MNSINKIFSLCLAISCFALAYLYFSSSNIPEGMFEDPKTGKAMLLGEVSIDELKQNLLPNGTIMNLIIMSLMLSF